MVTIFHYGKLFALFRHTLAADMEEMAAVSKVSTRSQYLEDGAQSTMLFGPPVALTQASKHLLSPREPMNFVRPERSKSEHPLSTSTLVEAPLHEIVFGLTAVMRDVKQSILSVANTDLPVLIQGEGGTGKNLIARFIHQNSTRSRNALVTVNCPAIPTFLLDTELFGTDRAAFADADQPRPGRVEQAHLGTLVLDQVANLDSFAQSKVLQVLQDGTYTRVGSHEFRPISTRVICTATTDLRKQVKENGFRADLLYRMNAITINLPPLRHRLEDLPRLIDSFSERHAFEFGLQRRPLSKEALNLMRAYHWPGNLRELDNLIRSYILIGDEAALISQLSLTTADESQAHNRLDIKKPFSLKRLTKKATRELERQVILKVLQAHGWNRQKTAKWLQISYRSLLYKLNETGPVSDSTVQEVTRCPRDTSLNPVANTTPGTYPLQVQ